MKYYYASANINPIEPAYTVGFSVDKQKNSETKLDLNLRLLYLKDENSEIILCSLDNLDVSYDIYLKFKDAIKDLYPNALLLITVTHTHYAPCLANQFPQLFVNETYLAQVLNTFTKVVSEIKPIEFDAYVSYNYVPFNKVGSTRVSRIEDSEVYAGVISIFDKEKRIGNLVHYNCHPTEDNKNTPYFSSAYVGAALKNLKEIYSDEFFIFLQGSCGDVSSRFTRTERSFAQTLRFGKLMSDCFVSLIEKNIKKDKLILSSNSITYDFPFTLKQEPEVTQELLSMLKGDEVKELYIGIEELRKLRNNENLPKINTINLNRINLGPYKLFLHPFEFFTAYNKLINKDNTLLIGYTNGALAYLLPVDTNMITYECFLETVCNDDKKKVIEAIKSL